MKNYNLSAILQGPAWHTHLNTSNEKSIMFRIYLLIKNWVSLVPFLLSVQLFLKLESLPVEILVLT